jgi:hypothetical protein
LGDPSRDRADAACAPACNIYRPQLVGCRRHPVCDLYSVTKGQQAIRAMTGAMMDRTGDGRAEGFVRCAAEALA